MIWLYLTDLMVLLGQETNAVLARAAQERKGTQFVRTKRSADRGGNKVEAPAKGPDDPSGR